MDLKKRVFSILERAKEGFTKTSAFQAFWAELAWEWDSSLSGNIT